MFFIADLYLHILGEITFSIFPPHKSIQYTVSTMYCITTYRITTYRILCYGLVTLGDLRAEGPPYLGSSLKVFRETLKREMSRISGFGEATLAKPPLV
jgi:hypothetical protein